VYDLGVSLVQAVRGGVRMTLVPSAAAPESILVVDDEPVNLEVLTYVLARAGYEVRLASSGTLALQSVETDPPDLILLDIMMPELDGFEVCQRLKNNPRSRGIPVIFLSALDEIEGKLHAFEVGGVDYICKPFEAALVLARVRTQLQQRRTERDLVRARVEAEQASRAKSQFLAALSHELRTPLNTILGFSEIIRDTLFGRDAVARYADYAGDIYDSGRYLLTLIDDILDIAKIEAGQATLDVVPIDVRQVVRAVIRLVTIHAREAGITINASCASDLPYLRGDERGVKRILFNLLSNAIRFSPTGGSITLHATAKPAAGPPGGDGQTRGDSERTDGQGDMIVLTVEDTGVGVPLDQIERLGMLPDNPSLRYNRAGGGLGLGLALVKALTALHGGTLSITTAEGRGTTVTVCMPAVARAA